MTDNGRVTVVVRTAGPVDPYVAEGLLPDDAAAMVEALTEHPEPGFTSMHTQAGTVHVNRAMLVSVEELR